MIRADQGSLLAALLCCRRIVRADAGKQEGNDADCDNRDSKSVQNCVGVRGLKSNGTYNEANEQREDFLSACDEELCAHGRKTCAGGHDLNFLRDNAAIQEGVCDTAQDCRCVCNAHAGGECQTQKETCVADRTDQSTDLSAEFIGHRACEGKGDQTAKAECCGYHCNNADVGSDIRITPLCDQNFLDRLLSKDSCADTMNEVGQIHNKGSGIILSFRLRLHNYNTSLF